MSDAALSGDQLLLGQVQAVFEGLHRCLAKAPTPLMGPRLIVALNPGIQVSLQFVDAAVALLTEGHAVELV